MRKFALLLMLVLALPAAASARPGDRGDGTFAVKSAEGQITVNAQGTFLGRVDRGQIAVVDPAVAGGGDVQVFGYDRKPVRANGTTTYRGQDMRFRIAGGWYSVVLTGTGLNVSAVGKGYVQGQGITDGLFSTDGAPFRPVLVPLYAASFGSGP